MTPKNPQESFTPYLPTTFNIPEEQDRIRVFLYDRFAQISDVVNDKVIGAFTQNTESINGKKWSYDTTKKSRAGYQAIARIPSFPNTGVLVLTLTSNPQFPITNINPQFVISLVHGSASKPCTSLGAGDGDYFSFMSQGDSRVSFTMSDNTITITTTVDLSAYSGFLIIEYIRDGV